MNVFSAGEDWIENPETYESSFYKRTLDNDIYIFTAPSFSSKFWFVLLLFKTPDTQASITEEACPSAGLSDLVPTGLARITLSVH